MVYINYKWLGDHKRQRIDTIIIKMKMEVIGEQHFTEAMTIETWKVVPVVPQQGFKT